MANALFAAYCEKASDCVLLEVILLFHDLEEDFTLLRIAPSQMTTAVDTLEQCFCAKLLQAESASIIRIREI
jgi:hypothetical protein